MSTLRNSPTPLRSSRRNLIKMSAILASGIIAKIAPATADDFRRDDFDRERDRGRHGWWDRDGKRDSDQRRHKDFQCFLKGTRIRTAEGEKKIEDLAVGDLLPTVLGGIRPIQWIGRYPFKKSDPAKAWVRDVLPVRVARSALGPNIPNADLYITKAHALFIDGLLVPVCHLINGTTITLYDAGELDELEFFHIKLELHDVIYAEEAPCETLVTVDENAVNFAEYIRQYGPPMIEDARCAPWVGFGRRLEIKSRFRSAISPWIDRRQKLDVIRDELEERGIALLHQAKLVSLLGERPAPAAVQCIANLLDSPGALKFFH